MYIVTTFITGLTPVLERLRSVDVKRKLYGLRIRAFIFWHIQQIALKWIGHDDGCDNIKRKHSVNNQI